MSAFGQTTATGLPAALRLAQAGLWWVVKPPVRPRESEDGRIIVDESIAEKLSTDENEIVGWHYDHSTQRHVKVINFVSCIYHSRGMALPGALR